MLDHGLQLFLVSPRIHGEKREVEDCTEHLYLMPYMNPGVGFKGISGERPAFPSSLMEGVDRAFHERN